MRRRHLPAAVVVVLAAVAFLLAACDGGGGLGLARQACRYVERSIAIYRQAEHDPDQAKAEGQFEQAAADLNAAEPLAAQANSADPQWNPLMTTLQESRRNSETNLIPALEQQCHQASLPNEQPAPYNSVPSGQGSASTTAPASQGGRSGPTTSAPTPSTLPGQTLPGH